MHATAPSQAVRSAAQRASLRTALVQPPALLGSLPGMGDIDADLVRRTLAGERTAYEALVSRHLLRARSVAGAQVADPAGVDDVVQEAFLRAYDRLGQLTDAAAFPAWLMAIVRNEATSWQRRALRRRTVGFAGDDPAVPHANDESERSAEADAQRERVRACLARLPREYREILALKYEIGLDYENIGEALGLTPANVEKRLYRARQALLALMGGSPRG